MPDATLPQLVDLIVRRNEAITRFWSKAFGWAPLEAANLLSKSRLDWQVSLSRTLSLWVTLKVEPDHPEFDGRLILAWANLGALVEGTLKWFASVFYSDYVKDQHVIRERNGDLVDPDSAQFGRLRAFFAKSVWLPHQKYDDWILEVQRRRNAIHAFRHRDIGNFDDFERSVRRYRDMLEELDAQAPYPEGYSRELLLRDWKPRGARRP